jgi:hypothetical protein
MLCWLHVRCLMQAWQSKNPTLFRMSSSANSLPSIPSLVQCRVAVWNAWNKLGPWWGWAENKQRTSQRHLCGNGAKQETSSQECEKNKSQYTAKTFMQRWSFTFFMQRFLQVYILYSLHLYRVYGFKLFTT